MPNVNQSFEGALLIKPGVYASDNVSAAQPVAPATTPPLIFIGYGYGGQPQTLLYFSDPQTLSDSLRGGPAAAFVDFLTSPSGELPGAQNITYINVGTNNTQSALTLYTSGAVAAITLNSANYGVPSNLLQAEVSTGTTAGKKITLYDAYAAQFDLSNSAPTNLVGDNLGIPFQLAYINPTYQTSGNANYTITVSGNVALSLALSGQVAGEQWTFQLGAGTYSTVTSLVEAINGTGAFAAQVLSDTSGELPTNVLDGISSASLPIPTGQSSPNSNLGTYQYQNVTAVLADPIFWVNTFASAMATATQLISTNDSNSGSMGSAIAADAVSNIVMTHFTGAESVVPTNDDYARAFNLALTTPGWVVFADSNMPAVLALGTQHALQASSITERRFRRFISGSTPGDTVATTIANAQSMNAKEATYCYPGIYRTNTQTGANELYGGLYVAAAIAGMMAGNRVAVPVTNKTLIGNGVETPGGSALTTAYINQLQQGGVLCIEVSSTTGVPKVISDLTTWQNDNNPENVFNQQVACRQDLEYGLIATLQPYVGQIDAGGTSLGKAQKTVMHYLNSKLYTGSGSSGTLAAWNPASLQLTFTGATQTLAVTVQVTFVGQNRFITVYTTVEPLNASVG